jgi:hypothetical protein
VFHQICCTAAAAAAAAAAAEYWVDNLNPEYLEKALANVMSQVMGALWGLLKPSTTMRPHAVTAMQLLGKLGKLAGKEGASVCVWRSHHLTASHDLIRAFGPLSVLVVCVVM